MRVGGSFKLECIATNDPQSPNVLKVKWFKGSTIINNNNEWIIYDISNNNKITFYLQLINAHQVDDRYSGRYTCSVYDSMITTDIEQSTNVIVEGMQLLHVCNLTSYVHINMVVL